MADASWVKPETLGGKYGSEMLMHQLFLSGTGGIATDSKVGYNSGQSDYLIDNPYTFTPESGPQECFEFNLRSNSDVLVEKPWYSLSVDQPDTSKLLLSLWRNMDDMDNSSL